MYFGHLFCLLSLIKSQKLKKENDIESVDAIVKSLLKLSGKKFYLKRMAYHGIKELIVQVLSKILFNMLWFGSTQIRVFNSHQLDITKYLLDLAECCNPMW